MNRRSFFGVLLGAAVTAVARSYAPSALAVVAAPLTSVTRTVVGALGWHGFAPGEIVFTMVPRGPASGLGGYYRVISSTATELALE